MTLPKRPASIRWFERLNLVSVAAALLYSWLAWDETAALAEADGLGSEVMLSLIAISCGVFLLVLWLIAWRRSNVAKWIWIVLSGFALLFVMIDYRAVLTESRFMIALAAIQFLVPVLTLWLLFRRDARRWFAGRSEVSPEVFR